MQVKFWGVRGSLASPGGHTYKYGGNTSCVQLLSNGDFLIFDAGSGLKLLGDALVKTKRQKPQTIHLFLSHYHLDHLVGLPFFAPLYHKNYTVHIYGPKPNRGSLLSVLKSLFAQEFFPVSLNQMTAKIRFHDLTEQKLTRNGFTITSVVANHPGRTLGYKITRHKKTAVYLCDHEPIEEFQHIKTPLQKYTKKLHSFLQGTDLLIHDAHFFDKEYPKHRGWGHSPWHYAISLAAKNHIPRTALFHHAPHHKDQDLTKAFNTYKKPRGYKFYLASENTILTL